jgi:hypothetical protein
MPMRDWTKRSEEEEASFQAFKEKVEKALETEDEERQEPCESPAQRPSEENRGQG